MQLRVVHVQHVWTGIVAALMCTSALSASDLRVCAVRGHKGVRANADDTATLQQALDDPLCEEVVLSGNHTFWASVLWVNRSDLILTIETNATLRGLPDLFREQRPDCATEQGLEFDWTHWCALLRVQAERNFTLRGHGTIAPGGTGGALPDFYSALHVASTEGVQLSGVRVHCTAWWWCTVLHNASSVHISSLHIDGSDGRDGLDLVNCRSVLIEDSRIEGSDDALCLKSISNDGLSQHPVESVNVRRTSISSTWCNAIQFGSATEVDIRDITFESVVISSARKAAIGIVSMDGANISQVLFQNVTIQGQNVATPIFIKLGNRIGCEDDKGSCFYPGSIKDVIFDGVTAVGWGNVSSAKHGHSRSYTPTIEGLNDTYPVGPILFKRLKLTAPGGGTVEDGLIDPPVSPLQYQPRYDGVRPSHGLFIRFAHNVTISEASIELTADEPDGRPAVVGDHVLQLKVSQLRLSSTDVCEMALRDSTGNWSGVPNNCRWVPNKTDEVMPSIHRVSYV